MSNQIREKRVLWSAANILRGEHVPAADDVMVWSGWFGESPWERDPRAWLPGGWDRLVEVLRAARAGLELRRTRWLLRPHARHVLNDPQRCAKFVEMFGGGVYGLAIDPVALLEPSMVPKWEEHTERVLARLAGFSECIVVSAAGVAGSGDDERVVLDESEGIIKASRVEEIARRVAPAVSIVFAGLDE